MADQCTVYSDNATTILLAGVGGQGTILAADLLAKTAMANGLEVKLSEIHGMSQRGGAVTTVVRIGEKVNSMVCCEGCADYLLSFETTEALRNIQYLKKGGMLLVNDESIKPLPVLTGKATMAENINGRLEGFDAHLVPATYLARRAGSPKCANVVLLGALAAGLPFTVESWQEQIKAKVPPKTIDMNLVAFQSGLDCIQA